MKFKISVMAMIFCLCFSIVCFAGEWKQEADGRWWYENNDGSYITNGWQSIDGKDYYFNAEGYLLVNTVTPDGYNVGADGAWINDSSANNTTAPLFQMELDDCSIIYRGWEEVPDYNGENCIAIYWDYTNKENKSSGAYLGNYIIKCYQDGIELDTSFSSYSDRKKEFQNYTKDVLSGTTLKVGKMYKLSNDNPVTVEVKELFNWRNPKLQTGIINLY